MNDYESDDHESIDNRTERALTEYMTVLDEGGDIYTVVGENENGAYQVDARKGRCTCPDHEHRNARCKHLRRVAFALGEEAIPSEVDDVDPQLGDHVGGEPITAEARADEGAVATDGGSEIIEAGDDGVILDDDDTDDRPDDCQCLDEYTDDDPLACWACYREGFDEPNPNGGDDSDSRPKPTRSEPADFGGGETTGVQDL